jgi:4-azaleucine resistance transporter AzlC
VREIERLEIESGVRRADFLAGVQSQLPIIVGAMPFGLIFGVLAIAAGLPPLLAFAMSPVVFAGSAQFIAVQLISSGAPPLILLLTAFIVNIRHLLYGASLAPHVSHLPAGWKWLLAYLMTDEAYATTIVRYHDREKPPATRHWFFLGAGLMLWASWQLSTAAGILLGASIPESWSLDFTLAMSFIGILIPALKNRVEVIAAVTAGIVAVLTFSWPYKLGLVAATLIGIIVGVWVQNQNKGQSATQPPGGKPTGLSSDAG